MHKLFARTGIKRTMILVVMVLLFGIAGAASAQTPSRIVVGYSTSHDFTDFWLERWQETLSERLGIPVESRIFDGSDNSFRSLVAGSVDVALGGISFVLRLNAVSRGEQLVVINVPIPINDYVIITGSHINSIEDLADGRIAIASPGSLSDVLMRLSFQRAGVDASAARWIRVGGTSARMAALVAGQVDAGIAHAESALEAEKLGLKALMPIGTLVDDYVILAMAARKSWVEQNRDLVQLMVDTQIDAARWAATDPEGYIGLALEYLPLSEETLTDAYEYLKAARIWGVNGADPALLEASMMIDVELGDISEPAPVEEWADFSFTENYLARNGSFDWSKVGQ